MHFSVSEKTFFNFVFLDKIKPLRHYASGIIDDPSIDDGDLNHVLTVVGYDNGEQFSCPRKSYWLLKNSWGPNWGEGGYVRVEKGNPDIKIGRWVLQPICEAVEE